MTVRFTRIAIAVTALTLSAGCAAALPTPRAEPPAAPTPAIDPDERVEIAEELYYRQVRPGVFIITHEFPWPANSMLVEMGNGSLVLVDTPYTPDAARAVLDWIRTRFGEREMIAINTGFHVDNLGGNSALIESNIPVYGSRTTARLIEENGEQTRAHILEWLEGPQYARYRDAHAAVPYVPPTHLFDLPGGIEIQVGGEVVQVYYPGPSHTVDNVVVYFPGRRVLFGGCMILAGDQVGNTADADLVAWPISVRRLSVFEFDILVPGHGDRYDPGLLEHTLTLLEAES